MFYTAHCGKSTYLRSLRIIILIFDSKTNSMPELYRYAAAQWDLASGLWSLSESNFHALFYRRRRFFCGSSSSTVVRNMFTNIKSVAQIASPLVQNSSLFRKNRIFYGLFQKNRWPTPSPLPPLPLLEVLCIIFALRFVPGMLWNKDSMGRTSERR